MEDDEITYEQIREILQKCKKRDVVSLPHNFYSRVKKYQKNMGLEYEKEKGFSQKARAIYETILRISRDVDDIYDRREKFIVEAAIIRARGGEVDHARNFTESERDLYESLIRLLSGAREKRSTSVDSPEISGERGVPGEYETRLDSTLSSRSGSIGNGPFKEAGSGEDSAIIVVNEDLPPFVGEDGLERTLKKGDVLSLPVKTAEILVSNGKAEVI